MYGFPVRHGKTQTTSLPHVFSENTRPLPPFSQTLLDTYPTQAVLGKLNDKKTNAKPKQRGKTEEKYQCQKLGPKWRFQWFQMPTRQFFFCRKFGRKIPMVTSRASMPCRWSLGLDTRPARTHRDRPGWWLGPDDCTKRK